MQPVASARESRMFEGVSTMLPMCVRNRRQEENIDQVYCNIEGGGRNRAIKVLVSMGELPNSFYTRKPEMTCCSISMLPQQFSRRIESSFWCSGALETRHNVDDKRWSMVTGILLEQLRTQPGKGDYAVLQCTRLVCSVQLQATSPRKDPALKILQCIISLSAALWRLI